MNERRILVLIIPFFIIGAISHAIPDLQAYMLVLTPYILLIFGAFCVYTLLREQDNFLLLWLLVVFLVSFSLESLGVATGLIFGHYTYGTVLGMHILGVPPIIGFNWALVILAASRFVQRISSNIKPVIVATLAASLCVLFDVILEPLAIRLGYWNWAPTIHTFQSVPLQNYAAWFVIAFLSSFFLVRRVKPGNSRFCEIYILIQTGFFLITRIMLALFTEF